MKIYPIETLVIKEIETETETEEIGPGTICEAINCTPIYLLPKEELSEHLTILKEELIKLMIVNRKLSFNISDQEYSIKDFKKQIDHNEERIKEITGLIEDTNYYLSRKGANADGN